MEFVLLLYSYWKKVMETFFESDRDEQKHPTAKLG